MGHPPPAARSDRRRALAARAFSIVEREYAEAYPRLCVQSVAQRLGTTPRQLDRSLEPGPPLRLVIGRVRAHALHRMLLRGDVSDARSAAASVGFASVCEMRRHYRRVFGESPERLAARLRAR
ncbi:helix-turn-helix domain-containing protein [Microbacterium sp. SORGH_AS_0888]|uniref:helix-turn-helix domain-containing protein n=1 Tax=Microbacterium sp. SORGH_AS_0888 TaxID=3041791 RepID=UPI002787320C|nr:helix-turn-helix domain-containing protein [Microbacterium sp. SORGH_AS_0888]MDQ1129423.1 transcriptional regulator GlxA family with amidase domain [Microbacterium sp. SORGH_AS_0888]